MAQILAVSSVCLGVGIWMQNRYSVSSIEKSFLETSWANLQEDAQAVVAHLSNVDVDPTPGTIEVSDATDLLSTLSRPLAHDRVVRILRDDESTDPITSSSQGSNDDGAMIASTQWTPTPHTASGGSRFERGQLTIGGVPYLGVAFSIPRSLGRMVICRSRADVEEEAASAVSDLRWIAALTFLWIFVVIAPTTYLLVAGIDDRVQRQRHEATAEKMQKIQEVLRSRDAVIFGLAKLAESRDSDTGHHLERIAMYSTLLATEMRRHSPFDEQISSTFVHLIGISSALHDIGKVGVPDRILLKPGPLTDEERRVMQQHAGLGGECLLEIERRLGTSSFLQMAREIAFSHHEHWNGLGYPRGLTGTEIPLAGRIVAIADVYDALSSPRVYKPAFAHDKCVQIIREEAGQMFDPRIVDVWMTLEPKFNAIARRFHGAVGGEAAVPNVVENAASSEAFEEASVTG